jgi:alpha-tubulin suppressor-like RCC1 family protein
MRALLPLILASAVASIAFGSSLALRCYGPSCIHLPQNLSLVGMRSFAEGAIVYEDGTSIAWNPWPSGENWGQYELPDFGQPALQIEIGRHGLALLADGTVRGWGYNANGQATPPAGLSNVRLIRVAEFHSIALTHTGNVICWGDPSFNRLAVPPGMGFVQDVRGGSHTVALLQNGTIRCWGWNGWGQCNPPANLEPVKAVSVTYAHTTVLTTDGRVRCWGRNSEGQCNVPPNLPPVKAIANGGLHTVALLESGEVVCWGDNSQGLCEATGLKGVAELSHWGSYYFLPDCDQNGFSDHEDIAAGSPDSDSNGIPDTCEVDPCPGDVTGGGQVNGVDLAAILGAWGTDGQGKLDCDINDDGTVDAQDLAIVLGGWGNCP